MKTPLTAIEYSTAGTPSVSSADAVLQSNLAKIGIKVQPKYFTRALQFQNEGVKGVAMDIANEGWIEDYPDPYDFMNILLSGDNIPKTGGNNFAYFNVPKYNQQMDHANTLSGNAALPGVRRHRDGHDDRTIRRGHRGSTPTTSTSSARTWAARSIPPRTSWISTTMCLKK